VYEWPHSTPAFKEELRARRRAVADAALDSLKTRVKKAVDTLDALLSGESESVRRSAAGARWVPSSEWRQ